ncbi:unannotated protein [freshwater metagenome]|uniref:Unannotated protein n=1 Tax=freshwater metagenome TaxID=449393 RepID=A0A6J7RGD6_9ZZZZ
MPTPDAPACTNAQRPDVSPPCRTSASHAVKKTSGIAAASAREMLPGTANNCRSWVQMYSAYAPPDSIAITRSPIFHILTRSPIALTTPEYSRPGISRKPAPRGSGYPPIRCKMSARLSAVARICTCTSSGPGTGTGTSSKLRTSGPPCDRKTTARMSKV